MGSSVYDVQQLKHQSVPPGQIRDTNSMTDSMTIWNTMKVDKHIVLAVPCTHFPATWSSTDSLALSLFQ